MSEMILPAVEPPFAWRSTASGPALECTALAPYAAHFFTTRPWALGSRPGANDDAWQQVSSAIGVTTDRLIRATQVHGARPIEALPEMALQEADILITRDPALAIVVQAADCVPLLIADTRTGAVAAVHAGWRGMAARAPQVAVRALVEEYFSNPCDLIAAIGPSIGACCYEVGDDVRAAFSRFGVDAKEWFREKRFDDPRNAPFRDLPTTAREGHVYFDGVACVRDQLIDEGISMERVFSPRLCTASHDILCSYRRNRTAAARIAGVIRPRVR